VTTGEQPQVPAREWEAGFRQGLLVPINGYWFRVIGVVREHGPEGALVLEPTGERTGRGKLGVAK
jgi:hypothetical protein